MAMKSTLQSPPDRPQEWAGLVAEQAAELAQKVRSDRTEIAGDSGAEKAHRAVGRILAFGASQALWCQ